MAMSDTDFVALVNSRLQNAQGYDGGKFSDYRIKVDKYYNGDKRILPFKEGRSRYISRDVAEVIDTAMASLDRVFCRGTEIVRFEPRKPEDEAGAAQATDYVNWVWNSQNKGSTLAYAWMKRALMYRVGVIKIYWDESLDVEPDHYEGLTQDQFEMVQSDRDTELTRIRSYPDPTWVPPQMPMPGMMPPGMPGMPPGMPRQRAPPMVMPEPPQLYDVDVLRKVKTGKVRIELIPCEEFRFNEYATDLDTAKLLAHTRRRTRSDLVDDGVSKSILDEIRFGNRDSLFADQEKFERFKPESEFSDSDSEAEDSLKTALVRECYLRTDYDGDGIAELRRVVIAGTTLIRNDIIESHPFALLTPVLMPNKLVGQSLADQTMDLQLIKSTMQRNINDNLYTQNNVRYAVNENNVNMDDFLNPLPGQPVRCQNPQADVVPLVVQPTAQVALAVIDRLDNVREGRTGITRTNQGLDPDRINGTATGVNLISQMGALRIELIARVFAESGFAQAFRRILELVCKHQDRPRIIKLRGRWTPIDPQEWSTQYDTRIEAGLGTGNRDLESQRIMKVQEVQGQIYAASPDQTIVGPQQIYESAIKLGERMGLKGITRYFADPSKQPPKPPRQGQQGPQNGPSDQAYIQGKQIDAQAKAQADQMQTRADMAKFQAQQQLEKAKLDRDNEYRRQKLAQEMAIAQMNAQVTLNVQREEMRLKYNQKNLTVRPDRLTIEGIQ